VPLASILELEAQMPNLVVSIIDDDPSVREGTMDLLNSAGFVAETFKDADEFLQSGSVDGASCVVADMRMPGMSGLELHDHLLRAGKNIPTILITAFPTKGDRARALESGVRCYLSKPFSEKDLLSHIRLALSSRDRSDGCQIPERVPPEQFGPKISLFHEPWWLSAATDGCYEESVVKQGSDTVGRLPFVIVRVGPFRTLRMPPFTHVLGPAVDAGAGKPQTRLTRRLSITRSLIDQLPSNFHFHQHLDPSLDDGLANADGLAFQERKFFVSPQYTFEVDCRQNPEDIWVAMDQKTRQPIRRAEEKYFVRSVDDPKCFIDFYLNNTNKDGRVNRIEFKCFPALFSECRAHECGIILGAFDHDSTPVAMTYLVWGHGIMYYLLSTRSSHMSDYGAVSLLVWSAMKQAHKLGLALDLDGVYSSGTVRFLSGFGGRIKTRLTIRRSQQPFRALQSLKRHYAQDEARFFT
jgi:CheY-like chemotaxis protein